MIISGFGFGLFGELRYIAAFQFHHSVFQIFQLIGGAFQSALYFILQGFKSASDFAQGEFHIIKADSHALDFGRVAFAFFTTATLGFQERCVNRREAPQSDLAD